MASPPSYKRRKIYFDAGEELLIPKSTYYRRLKETQTLNLRAPILASNSPEISDDSSIDDDLDGEDDHDSIDSGGIRDVCASDPEGEDDHDSIDSGSSRDGRASESAQVSPDESTTSDSASDRDCIETADNDSSTDSNVDDEAADFQPGPVFEDILSSCFEQFGTEKLPHTETTKAGAIAMVMSFIAGNGLTWSALGNLVCMINTMFGKDVLPRTKYVFRKLWAAKTKDLVNYHYICPSCEGGMKMEGAVGTCQVCQQKVTEKKLRTQGSFFMILDMEKQVKFLIGKTRDALGENLLRPAGSSDDPITDITTGKGYQQMREDAKLAVDDLTLTINTDGSPVFESSKICVWPVQFVLNELPPKVRFKHPTLAGLWIGKTHPNMQTFIAKFVEAVNSMQPVKWEHKSNLHTSRAFVLCCSVDAPARAAVQNMVLFNGYHGCPWCLIRGEYLEGSMRYISNEAPAPRSSAMVSRDMQLALTFKESVNGIKGPSAMMNLPGFNLVTGYSVEYMHCVLQGVARQMTELLFSSSNSHQRFYIGTAATLARVNRRLLSIRPPHCITRLPRSLSERSYWKASEWRHWLLFYALPCLHGILPTDYWKHLAKLCEAIHILLRDSITLDGIQQAELLLESFVGRSETLYGATSTTFNVHQLLHLGNCVRQLGPLWAHSAFVFEGGNGRIVRLVTAARGLPEQILERVVMAQQVECLLATAKLPDREQAICKSFLGFPPIRHASHLEGTCLLGSGSAIALSAVERLAVEQHCDLPCTTGTEYERFVFQCKVFHSAAYSRPEKSDTTVVSTQDGEYFKIEKIIVVPVPTRTCFLLCRRIILMEESCFPPHINECFLSEGETLSVLEPTMIKDSCVYIDFESEKKSFVCDLPNSIERD